MFKELVEREEKRKKQSSLARRMEKEAKRLARRKEDDKLRKMPGARASIEQHQPDPMEWDEHDLEYQMASLGLDMDDLFMMEEWRR